MIKKMVQIDESVTAPIAAAEQPLKSGGPGSGRRNDRNNQNLQTQRKRSMSLSLSWRRPKSGTLTRVDGPSPPRQLNDNAIDDSEDAHDLASKRSSGRGRAQSATIAFKGVIRRASYSLRDLVHRRPSVATEATVYEEHTTPARAKSSGTSSDSSPTSVPFASLNFPRGARNARREDASPTEYVIPPTAGAAAKASVASQTQSLRQPIPSGWYYSRDDNDRESGIGIIVSDPWPETDSSDGEPAPQDSSISRVDFVTRLPTELAIHVLAYLDAAALAKASAVSKGWKNVVANQHIWRESCLRETTATYATGGPVEPGSGLGVPRVAPSNDWKEIYRVKMELNQRWKEGLSRPVYLNGHTDSIYCLQFDEYKIVSGSRDKTIRIWDMQTFKCTLVIGPPDIVHGESMLEDSDGNLAHYASYPDQRKAVSSTPKLVSFEEHHMASILCLQYDDEILVTGSSDFTCLVYDVRDGYRPIRRLRHHSAAVLDLTFDKKHIVTCSKDVSICVWDRETGSLLRQLRGHTGPVNAVQMRGNSIVSCSGDFRVKLWNIDTGKNIREFVGHTKGLACSQFSEDGRYVASAGNDKVIRIWDANTGECVREMKAHENLVRSLHIDSVSGRLISGSYDTDIKVWDMETGHQLLDFPRWHASWVLSAKSDYRRIVSTGQDAKILIMDFGADVRGIEMLASERR